MANLHEGYLAGHVFDITNPGLKTDYRSAALHTGEYAYMYVYMCECSNVCVPEGACVYAGDGWTYGEWRDGWI